jgi:2,5-furandicarboxylate decarboxylase 1
MSAKSDIYDLRTFLEALRAAGRLKVVTREVDWDKEAGSVIASLEKGGGYGALLKKVKGSKFSLAGGMLASMENVAVALGCEIPEITSFIEKRLDKPIEPEIVDQPVCQDVVISGDEVNLFDLPIPRHAPKDGGRFITGGLIFSKGLGESRTNISFQRCHIKEKNKMGIMINEWRHLREFYEAAEKEGKALPISIVCGADPVLYISAGLRSDLDETALAGSLRGAPVKVAKSVTNDIYVPAYGEFVIEGEILPDLREEEGPLGEFTGTYSEPWASPVVKVKAITHRKNAIYQTINGASFEHINLGNTLPREPLLHHFTSYVSSGVIDVHIPPYGCGFLAIVQIKKKNPGEPKNVALAAMMTYVNIKNVIVVDEDVDIYDPADLMWALSTRVNSERDIFYVPHAQGHELDPSSDIRGVQTKMGIDATADDTGREYERVSYPLVNLAEYLDIAVENEPIS